MADLMEAVAWYSSWHRKLTELHAEIEARMAETTSVFGEAAWFGTDGTDSEKGVADRGETADGVRRLNMAMDAIDQASKQLEALKSRAVVLSDNVRDVEARRAEMRRKLVI